MRLEMRFCSPQLNKQSGRWVYSEFRKYSECFSFCTLYVYHIFHFKLIIFFGYCCTHRRHGAVISTLAQPLLTDRAVLCRVCMFSIRLHRFPQEAQDVPSLSQAMATPVTLMEVKVTYAWYMWKQVKKKWRKIVICYLYVLRSFGVKYSCESFGLWAFPSFAPGSPVFQVHPTLLSVGGITCSPMSKRVFPWVLLSPHVYQKHMWVGGSDAYRCHWCPIQRVFSACAPCECCRRRRNR